jgi:hypothetical protein
MKFEFPYKGEVSQMNKGEAFGSLHTSYGTDFSLERGRILNSPNALTLLTEATTADITSPVTAFCVIDSRWYGIANKVFRAASGSADDPTNTWALDTSTSTPTGDYGESDMVVFNQKLYASGISGTGDIYELSGSTWTSWWQGTLAQSALSSTGFKAMKVGPNGRLYILDNYRKVYNVTTAGVVTKTGNGTLDFSSAEYRLDCMVMSSNRMWLGGRDLSTGGSVVIEWDMSLNEATANKIYTPGANGVFSIVIWDDSPVLMLSDGSMRFYDGSKFYRKDGAHLPKPPDGYEYHGNIVSTSLLTADNRFMHQNGSAIIDNMPHFLMSGTLRDSTGTNYGTSNDAKYFAGVFCYDPELGLYNRFPIGTANTASGGSTMGFGSNTEYNTGANMGALVAVPSQKTRFLASAEIPVVEESWATIFSDDRARTLASRSRFVLNPLYGTAKDLWQKIEVLSKRLNNSADRILLKYRLHKSSSKQFKAAITWVSSTSFTSTDTNFANVEAGDWVMVSEAYCASATAHISAISYSNPTYTITVDEAFGGWISSLIGESGRVVVDNWRRLATISNQKNDYHDLSVPTTEGAHTFWLMVELRAAAGSVVELDKIIVTSKEGK